MGWLNPSNIDNEVSAQLMKLIQGPQIDFFHKTSPYIKNNAFTMLHVNYPPLF